MDKAYNKIIGDHILREKAGIDYCRDKLDDELLFNLFNEINNQLGTNIRYLSELDSYNIIGSGEIISKYITNFSSESIKAYLVPQLVFNKVKDCDKLILQLYLHFKSSKEYFSETAKSTPAHIYVRYDNAFRKLKPKRLKTDLLQLSYSQRDVFYLPFTMRMLASWRVPELKEQLISFLTEANITEQSFGLKEDVSLLPFIRRQLLFTALDGLKYYPSQETIKLIERYVDNEDTDINSIAKRTQALIEKSKR